VYENVYQSSVPSLIFPVFSSATHEQQAEVESQELIQWLRDNGGVIDEGMVRIKAS
jgi:hypothetical protein